MKILRKPIFLFNERPVPSAPQARPTSSTRVNGLGAVAMMTNSFPDVVSMLRTAGLCPHPPQVRTQGCSCLSDEVDYSHILEHCCAVGLFVEIVGQLLVDSGVWSDEERHQSTIFALLHDCAKRIELAFFSRAGTCPVHQSLQQSRKSKDQYIREMLRELGFTPEQVSLIVESQSCCDLEQLSVYSPINSYGALCLTNESMRHLIVQLGDACTATNYNGVRGTAYMHPAMRISSTGLQKRFPHFPRAYAVTTESNIRALTSAEYSSVKTDVLWAYPAIPFLRAVAHAFAYSVCSMMGQQVEHPLAHLVGNVSRRVELVGGAQ